MPHVSMSEEHPVNRLAVRLPFLVSPKGMDLLDLGRKVRRCIHEVDVASLWDVNREARHVPDEARIVPGLGTLRAVASGLRHSSILHRPQDNDPGTSRS